MEKELKFVLADRASYDKLLGGLSKGPTHLQKNYYFDSADGRLNQSARSALRVRGEGEAEQGEWTGPVEWEVTLKMGVAQEGAYFQAHEWNASIEAALVPSLLEGGEWPAAVLQLEPMQHFAQHFGPQSLVPLGGLHNLRIRCPLFDDEVAEVDQTTFPDGSVDFEIEVETESPDEVESFLVDLANWIGLTLERQSKTKFRRFLERAKR